MKKLFALVSAVALIGLFASCELFDPPPSDTEMSTAMSDMTAGVTAATSNASNATITGTYGTYPFTVTMKSTDNKVTVVGTYTSANAISMKITFAGYTGTKYTVTGSLEYTGTVSSSTTNYTANGTLTFTGGTVRSVVYKDLSGTSSANGSTTFAGTITVNDYYKFDASTYKRIP